MREKSPFKNLKSTQKGSVNTNPLEGTNYRCLMGQVNPQVTIKTVLLAALSLTAPTSLIIFPN